MCEKSWTLSSKVTHSGFELFAQLSSNPILTNSLRQATSIQRETFNERPIDDAISRSHPHYGIAASLTLEAAATLFLPLFLAA